MLERARAKDPAALEQLLVRCEARVRELARKKMGAALRSQMDSVDLQQSVMREVLQDIEQVEAREEGVFLAWLAGVTANKLRNKVRDAKRRKRDGGRRIQLVPAESSIPDGHGVDPPDASPSPRSQVEARERVERVRAALDDLDPDLRRVVELRMLGELPWGEVARQLGVSIKAAQGAWARARVRLGQLLDD